jgi:hypothetical protein
MLYLKTSQPIPGKGDAWTYYELNDDQRIARYVTYIPVTGESEKVEKPLIKKLYRPELCADSSQDEFESYWNK